MGNSTRGLVVGNYCHDVLLKDDVVTAESLGGAASFIANIFHNFPVTCDYVSKVGSDFNYSVTNPPIVVPTSPTTLFHAHFKSTGSDPGPDRTLKRVSACDPIRPGELPEVGSGLGSGYGFGMAVGVGGEILPDTLEKMVEICDIVFVDVQGLIREFDEIDGRVRLIKLKDTKFNRLLSKIGVLKASSEEAEFIDVEEVRKVCCVVVTDGEDGCRVYWKDGEIKIEPFSTFQVDPTGAGDSLLGGLVAGLVHGLPVPDAALLGNFFGCLTVGQIGLPKFDPKLLQRVKDEVQKRALECAKHRVGDENELWFAKPPGHEKFYEALNSVRQASYTSSVQESEYGSLGLQDRVSKPVNHGINHVYNGQKVLSHPVYDEPIQAVEGTP
ncbi:inositol 3-kinase [Silene latifolia]|uniref:inositol 3-kinase n=1 Tax=Silene latifolia TaxID=37657 RepID=UPI003D78760B